MHILQMTIRAERQEVQRVIIGGIFVEMVELGLGPATHGALVPIFLHYLVSNLSRNFDPFLWHVEMRTSRPGERNAYCTIVHGEKHLLGRKRNSLRESTRQITSRDQPFQAELIKITKGSSYEEHHDYRVGLRHIYGTILNPYKRAIIHRR